MPVTIAGKVKDFDPKYGMDKAFIRKQDKFTQFAMAAAYQAMEAAGLRTEGERQNIDPFRLGVYVGSGIGGFEIQYRETAKMVEDPPASGFPRCSFRR
jgi:3-oxoacyl-(acyl-carrier-protein) synthase